MRVLKSDLDAVGSSVAAAFDAEIADAGKIITVLENFMSDIGSGTKLTGRAYENIKSQLNEQKALMEKRKTLAESMKESIESAIRSMGDYMGGYSILDDADLDEVEASISAAESSISSLKYKLNNIDDNSTNDNMKGNIMTSIGWYESKLLELYEWRDKLEGLPGASSGAWGCLSEAIGGLTVYNSGSSSV